MEEGIDNFVIRHGYGACGGAQGEVSNPGQEGLGIPEWGVRDERGGNEGFEQVGTRIIVRVAAG